MNDELRVEYPCDPALRSVGRVAVIGVLLRLRTPMMAVEQFRNELDAATQAAAGADPPPGSKLRLHATWTDAEVTVVIEGPASTEKLSRPRLHR